MTRLPAAFLTLPLLLAGCGDHARLNIAETTGPAPTLPPPANMLIPTVHVARATGWPAGTTPTAAPGLQVAPFATGLEHPRWLLTLPNGDVLVAETAAPPPDPGFEDHSIKGYFFHLFQEQAGSAVPSPNPVITRQVIKSGRLPKRSARLPITSRPSTPMKAGMATSSWVVIWLRPMVPTI